MKRKRIYEKLGITVEKIEKEIIKIVLLLPIITYFITRHLQPQDIQAPC